MNMALLKHIENRRLEKQSGSTIARRLQTFLTLSLFSLDFASFFIQCFIYISLGLVYLEFIHALALVRRINWKMFTTMTHLFSNESIDAYKLII